MDKSGVVFSCLNCFSRNDSVYLYKYGVKWYSFVSKVRGGTCTTAKSDPPEEVVQRAKYLLHHEGFGEFNELSNNCEDFALYCKTGYLSCGKGSGNSNQASSAMFAPASAVVSLPLRFFTPPPVYLVATAVLYSTGKYAGDLGVSQLDDDLVKKVKVEEVAKFIVNRKNPIKND